MNEIVTEPAADQVRKVIDDKDPISWIGVLSNRLTVERISAEFRLSGQEDLECSQH